MDNYKIIGRDTEGKEREFSIEGVYPMAEPKRKQKAIGYHPLFGPLELDLTEEQAETIRKRAEEVASTSIGFKTPMIEVADKKLPQLIVKGLLRAEPTVDQGAECTWFAEINDVNMGFLFQDLNGRRIKITVECLDCEG